MPECVSSFSEEFWDPLGSLTLYFVLRTSSLGLPVRRMRNILSAISLRMRMRIFRFTVAASRLLPFPSGSVALCRAPSAVDSPWSPAIPGRLSVKGSQGQVVWMSSAGHSWASFKDWPSICFGAGVGRGGDGREGFRPGDVCSHPRVGWRALARAPLLRWHAVAAGRGAARRGGLETRGWQAGAAAGGGAAPPLTPCPVARR